MGLKWNVRTIAMLYIGYRLYRDYATKRGIRDAVHSIEDKLTSKPGASK